MRSLLAIMPVVLGLINAPRSGAQSSAPAFEVASIKLNHGGDPGMIINIEPGGKLVAMNIPVKLLLKDAYQVHDDQILGAPSWVESERYDIEAKAEDSAADGLQKATPEKRNEQFRLMMRSLLANRLKLILRHDTKDLPVYALVVAKNGPKFKETILTPADFDNPKPRGLAGGPRRVGAWITGRGQVTVDGMGIGMFANLLSIVFSRVVLDKTGLSAKYDFKLQWTPDDSREQIFKGASAGPPTEVAPTPDATGPTLFAALQEQLGLKLESQKSPLDVLVIEHIERPSEN